MRRLLSLFAVALSFTAPGVWLATWFHLITRTIGLDIPF
jgi:hypothetical protein